MTLKKTTALRLAARRTMSFRPSPEMRRKLERAVEKSGRSLSQEIELRLELGHAPVGGEKFSAQDGRLDFVGHSAGYEDIPGLPEGPDWQYIEPYKKADYR